MIQDSPELLFRMIIYLKEHDRIQFWGQSGNLGLKHSLKTQDGGADPQEEETKNVREN